MSICLRYCYMYVQLHAWISIYINTTRILHMTCSIPLHVRYGPSHTGPENLALNAPRCHWRCPWSWTVTGAVRGANRNLPHCGCFRGHEALCLGNTVCPVQTHAVRAITRPGVLAFPGSAVGPLTCGCPVEPPVGWGRLSTISCERESEPQSAPGGSGLLRRE